MTITTHWKSIALLCIGTPVVCYSIWYLLKSRHRTASCSSKAADYSEDEATKSPYDQAMFFKNRGNKFFKASRYEQAIECYTNALKCCPEEAVNERATFYQNRAAANENLKNFEAALSDINSALELSPKYLKALNRRAHLFEKLDRLQECLLDVTACCIFEQFRNAENVLCVDRVLKRLGQQKAKEERPNLPRELPSTLFIQNYLGAFAWDPFLSDADVVDKVTTDKPTLNGGDSDVAPHGAGSESSLTGDQNNLANVSDDKEGLDPRSNLSKTEASDNKPDLHVESPEKLEIQSPPVPTSTPLATENLSKEMPSAEPESVTLAMTTLAAATESMISSDYENSMQLANTAGEMFANAKQDMVDATATNPDWLLPALRAAAKCTLLQATYLALRGQAEEAADLLNRLVKAHDATDGMIASPVVKMNALVKTACLAMTVNQDLAACLFSFQCAQELCPDCPDVYLHRGQIHLLADQLDEAYYDLNRAVQLRPEFSIPRSQCCYTVYRRAIANQDEAAIEDSINQFSKLIERFPNCQETHSLYAQLLTERGDFEKADMEFAKVIEIAPDSGLAYAHRGLLQLRWRQDRDAAEKWFNKGVKRDPRCELVHELSGQLAVERGQFDAALQHFDAAIRQSKTLTDLAHLMSLRDGVIAQMTACQRYGISIHDMLQSLQQDEKQAMILAAAAAAAAAGGGGGIGV